MKTRRTAKQWQQLIHDRKEFRGTNAEFCQHHGISITSFYKRQASLRAQSPSGFVQVKTTTELTRVERHGEIQMDLRTGKLCFPASLPVAQIVELVKGLSQ